MYRNFILLLLLLFFGGCAPKEFSVVPQKELPKILGTQDATSFVSDDALLIDEGSHKKRYEEFLRLHFKPWSSIVAPKSARDEMWGIDFINRNRLFGESKQPFTKSDADKLISQMALERFPNSSLDAITLKSVDARVLPTHKPLFLDFDRAGEGYPFDYMQNSQIHPMTPIKVWHLSRDGSWAYIESGFVSGWVEIGDIALLEQKEIAQFKKGPLIATISDSVPVYDEWQNFLFYANIGSVFTQIGTKDGFYEIVVATTDKKRRAVLISGFIPKESVAHIPKSPTQKSVARLINKMLGVNYGWGGMYGNRDCSSFLRDLFVPFGIYLPRNSAAQAKAWDFVSFAGKNRDEKLSIIKADAKPFGTILWKRGHVMLYLGERDKEPYIAHALWGVRTKDKNGKDGRYVVGKSVITSMYFGREHPDFDEQKGDVLDSLLGMSILR